MATSSDPPPDPVESTTELDHDTILDPRTGKEHDASTTQTSLGQGKTSSTLLSTPAPATNMDRYFQERLRGLEDRLDELGARVRLLEKEGNAPELPRQALWLLTLPLLAILYWLSRAL